MVEKINSSPPVSTMPHAEDLGALGEFWGAEQVGATIEADAFREEIGKLGAVAVQNALLDASKNPTPPLELPPVTATDSSGIDYVDTDVVRPDLGIYGEFWNPEPEEKKSTPTQRVRPDWNEAARTGKSFSRKDGLWPASRKEWRQAQRSFRKRDEVGTMRAARRTLEGGVYRIDGLTGRSSWRGEDGSLEHLPRKTARRVKRDEKRYAELSRKIAKGEDALQSKKKSIKIQRVNESEQRGINTQLLKRAFLEPNPNNRDERRHESGGTISITVNGVERAIPSRPSQRSVSRARTSWGKRYQAQQERNKRGVV